MLLAATGSTDTVTVSNNAAAGGDIGGMPGKRLGLK